MDRWKYLKSPIEGGDVDVVAGVGACKTTTCSYNSCLECQASSITVGYREGESDCLTFSSR